MQITYYRAYIRSFFLRQKMVGYAMLDTIAGTFLQGTTLSLMRTPNNRTATQRTKSLSYSCLSREFKSK